MQIPLVYLNRNHTKWYNFPIFFFLINDGAAYISSTLISLYQRCEQKDTIIS